MWLNLSFSFLTESVSKVEFVEEAKYGFEKLTFDTSKKICPMKSCLFFFLLLISCRPEFVEVPTDEAMAVSLQTQFPSVTSAVSLKKAPPGCGLPLCDEAIPAAEAALQAVADSTCLPVYGCMDCCMDGKIASVTLYVEPKVKCPIASELPKE